MRFLGSALLLASAAGCSDTSFSVAEIFSTAHQSFAESLYPAELKSPERADQPAHKLRLRIYVEEAFRAHSVDWDRRLRAQVEQASRVLYAELGVELEVVELRDWPTERRLDRDLDLDAALRALRQLDPGADVDFVLGYVGAQPLFTLSLHQLGLAYTLGQHAVFRQIDDSEEFKALEASFGGDVLVDRLHPIYEARLRHKETVLLLHELGHALGALHAVDGSEVMSPLYDPRISHFSAWNHESMAIALAARRVGARQPWEQLRRALSDHLAGADPEQFIQDDYQGLRRLLAEAPAGAEADPDQQRARQAARMQFNAYVKANDRRSLAASLALARDEPDDPELALLACAQSARWAPEAAESVFACERAVARTPTTSAARMDLAEILIAQAREDEALVYTEAAAELIERGGPPGPSWRRLAWLWSRLNLPTRAAAAAEHDDDPGRRQAVLTWAAELWGHLEVGSWRPPPAQERSYVTERLAIDAALSAGTVAVAERRSAALAKAGMRDASVSICSYYYRGKLMAKVREHCGRALAKDPQAARAHLLLGSALISAGEVAAGIRSLERAVACPTSTKDMWKTLRVMYQATGAGDRIAALDQRYRQRFGKD